MSHFRDCWSIETQDKSSTERVKNDKNAETLVNSTADVIKIVAGEKLRTKFNKLTQKHKGVDDKDRTSRKLRQARALIDKLKDPLGN